MTYQSVSDMAASQSLQKRCVAAAAQEGSLSPEAWVAEHVWQIVSYDDGWVSAWDFAVDNATLDNNPDTGARPGVINDDMILTVVQALMAAPPP
jgi:hypothetical protein